MTTELQFQSKITERLVKKNDELIARNKKLRRDLQLKDEQVGYQRLRVVMGAIWIHLIPKKKSHM